MRKILISMLVLLLTMPAWAQNYCLTITQKNGDKFSFAFSEKPVVTCTETDIRITTEKTEIQYAMTSVRTLTFDETPTKVEEPQTESKGDFSIYEDIVTISGTKANMAVRVIDLQGRPLLSYQTDEDGYLTFSIGSLGSGTYIITSETVTCKILKR